MPDSLPEEDQQRIDAILSFWFKEQTLSAPQIDQRMDTWFGANAAFDHEIQTEFSVDIDNASAGQLNHWAGDPRGRLALILLIDQFRRNVYRNTTQAFEMDKIALKLCVEGAIKKMDAGLAPIERVFFYMPLQHSESAKVQAKACELFNKLAEIVSPTFQETFSTVAQFAELHRDIIDQFGRFPHRNKILGRQNTAEEDEYLGTDSPDFGQSS